MDLKRLANLTMAGYGRRSNNSLPVYTAEQVIQMTPDENALPHTFATQGDRDLFEYTPWGQSKLLAPHENSQEHTPRHRRIEYLANRLFGLRGAKPDREQFALAHRVQEAFGIIEATAEIVDTFISRCLEMGPEKLERNIAYIENLAAELKAVEVQEEAPPEDGGISATGEYSAHASRGIENHLTHLWEMAHDQDLERWGPLGWHYNESNTTCLWPIRENITDAVDIHHLADPDGRVDWGSSIRYPGEYDGWDQEKMEADHATPASIEQIGYHPIDAEEGGTNVFLFSGTKSTLEIEQHYEPFVEKDWLTRQPLTFRILIRETRRCKDISMFLSLTQKVRETTWDTYTKEAKAEGLGTREIKALTALVKGNIKPYSRDHELNGKVRYAFRINKEGQERVMDFYLSHIPPMTSAQAGVFWTFRTITRDRLGLKPLKWQEVGPQGQKLLTRIGETKTLAQLKWLGAKLIDFDKGKIRGCKMTRMEFKKVWEAYHEKKEAFAQTAAA